jgi:hypothetical protein
MKKESELRGLLDRLKGEVRRSPGPGLPPVEERARREDLPSAAPGMALQSPPRPEKYVPVPHMDFQRPEHCRVPASSNMVWSENKEAMLFGVLASLAAMLGGILAGIGYVILAGAVSFVLFSFVMVLTLFGYYLNFRKNNSDEGRLENRVEQLSRRLESIAVKNLSGPSYAPAGSGVKDRELDRKVEELRTLVRSLAKAVEKGGD